MTDLTQQEEHVLTGFAVVGDGSLSVDELAEASGERDVRQIVAALEQRRLIAQDSSGRFCAVGRLGDEIRSSDAAMGTADRLRGYLITLADTGQMTPDRLADEMSAILGLSEWAADHEEWSQVLEIVKTLEACFALARRIEGWLTLLRRGRAAAQALGNHEWEVWILRQLSSASVAAGDRHAAQEYLREATEVRLRGASPPPHRFSSKQQPRPQQPPPPPPPPPQEPPSASEHQPTHGPPAQPQAAPAPQPPLRTPESVLPKTPTLGRVGRSPHPAAWVAIAVVGTVLGLGGGYAVGQNRSQPKQITTQVPLTATVHGKTLTQVSTITLPAVTTTITTTTTSISTVTTTVTSVG